MKQVRHTPPQSERDAVLREVEQLLALARSVRLGPEFDDIIRTAVEGATDRLVSATRRRTARLSALAAIQQTVTAGFDLPAIMAGVYAHLQEILDAPSFVVSAYDAAADTLNCAFAVADGAIVPSSHFDALPLGNGPQSQVVRTAQPRIVNDLLKDPAFAGRRPVQYGDLTRPVRSLLYVPMRRGDDVVGVMQAQSYRPDAYSQEDVDFLATIANQAAMALENARLYEEALRHSREVESLLTASQQISAELAADRVLERVAEAAAGIVDAEVAAIGLVDGDRLRFDQVLFGGRWQPALARVRPDAQVFPCCLTGQPVLDNALDPAVIGALARSLPPVRSRLAMPILGPEQRVLGVIQLFNKRSSAGFTARDLELTAALASQAGMAMERASAFRAMEQSRNYLQTLMDRSFAAIFVLDPAQGRLRDVNHAGTTLLGRSREEALAQRIFDLAPQSDRDGWHSLLRETTAGETIERELHIQTSDGSSVPLEVKATRVDMNDAPALVCLCLDRRPRIRQQEAARLRSLGEMASGVAHDFNNMLGVILGRTELMIARINGEDRTIRSDLQVIKQAAFDGAETVKRLQAFSGVARFPQHDVSDVYRTLRDAVEFTRARWKDGAQRRGIAIDVEIEAGDVPAAAAAASDLREVLVNMIFNAVDAMPHGGKITLRSWSEAGRVLISVSDTGVGMTEAVRNKVFEPYFTTKGARGTGLGLSASYGIISRLGGNIALQSAPFAGTTFTIDLPAGEAKAEEVTAPRTATGPLTLLLVDDEPQMLRTSKMMLEIEGHTVTAVSGGRAALEALAKQSYDALLTDLGMPEISGIQLAEMARARGFTLPILLITGWGLELEPEKVRESGINDILPKPFDGEKLRARLAAITGQGSRGQQLSVA